jgi:uncharacterized protein
MSDKKLITCVYCGHKYPDQTLTSGAQILKDHIKVCEKHPMREAEEKIRKLRAALIGFIGESDKDGLKKIEISFDRIPGLQKDKIAAINAIRALLETAD